MFNDCFPSRKNARSARRGVIGGVTELLITLAVGGIVLGGLATTALKQATSVRNQATALQFQQVHTATSEYIRNEQDAIRQDLLSRGITAKPCSGGDQPGKYTDIFQTLKTKNYLPSYFGDKNPYGQPYKVLATTWCQDAAKGTYAVRSWVMTTQEVNRSRAISKADVAGIAASAGDSAGYIPYDTDPAYASIATPTSGSKILGAFGSWKTTSLDQLLPALDMPAGHLAAPIVAGGNVSVNDYLYRHEVPGNPDANKMSTDLGMDGGGVAHSIRNAADVGADRLIGTTGVYAGYTVDASTGALMEQGAGEITARGDITSDGGDVKSVYDPLRGTGGNITATGGNISAEALAGLGGNITATGGDITATEVGGTGGRIKGKYLWMNQNNTVREHDRCDMEGALTFNSSLGDEGEILICRGTPLEWQIYRTDLRIDHVCNSQRVWKSSAIDCPDGQEPAVSLLGLNERTPVNACAMVNRFWNCYFAPGAGNSATNLTGTPVTYNTSGSLIYPSCHSNCQFYCTPMWQQSTCLPQAQLGKRGWTKDNITNWEFFVATYDVAFGGFIWNSDPLNVGGTPPGGPSSFPGAVWMQYNPWCTENYPATDREQDACLAQVPQQLIVGDCAGALYFCLPANTTPPGTVNIPASITLSPSSASFTVSGTTIGTTAYSTAQTFTVTNCMGCSATSALAVQLSSSTDFEITGTNGCQGRSLPAGSSCTFNVRAKASDNKTLTPTTLVVSASSGGVRTSSLSGSASGFAAATPKYKCLQSSWEKTTILIPQNYAPSFPIGVIYFNVQPTEAVDCSKSYGSISISGDFSKYIRFVDYLGLCPSPIHGCICQGIIMGSGVNIPISTTGSLKVVIDGSTVCDIKLKVAQ